MSRRELVDNAKEVVKCDLEVFVKVISISGQLVSFSMRDVDQITGQDLLPLKKSGDDESLRTNPISGRSNNAQSMTKIGPSGIRITDDEDVGVSSRTQLMRMWSRGIWEAKRLEAYELMNRAAALKKTLIKLREVEGNNKER